MGYWQNLKSKPHSARRRVAFFLSSGITFIIFLLWITSFGALHGSSSATASASLATNRRPVALILGAISDAYSQLKSGITEAGQQLNK